MKPIPSIFILLLMPCFCLVGCKTSSTADVRKDVSKENSSELLLEQLQKYLSLESTSINTNETFNGKLNFYSPPDSTGKQYLVADLDFSNEKNTNFKQEKKTVASDSTKLSAKAINSFTDKSVLKTIKQTNSQLFDPIVLTVLIGIAVIIIVFFKFSS
jgi:hypothetical protein